MEPIVVAKKLVKKYGSLVAVDNIDFEVYKGECFGFLGPNGAGKTSTISMITCFSPMTAGVLDIFGMDARQRPREIKHNLGVVPQEMSLDDDLNVIQNLLVYANYYDIPKPKALERSDELLKFMKLEEKKKEPIEKLSSGMRRRLVIARALINKPSMLIMDEPTTGLDPQARHLVWHKLRNLKEFGVTMILTTHYMEEASQLCDRLVIMDEGKVLAEGSPSSLIKEHAGAEVIELKEHDHNFKELEREFEKTQRAFKKIHDVIYVFAREKFESEAVLARIKGTKYCYRPAELEDVYLKLTGKELH